MCVSCCSDVCIDFSRPSAQFQRTVPTSPTLCSPPWHLRRLTLAMNGGQNLQPPSRLRRSRSMGHGGREHNCWQSWCWRRTTRRQCCMPGRYGQGTRGWPSRDCRSRGGHYCYGALQRWTYTYDKTCHQRCQFALSRPCTMDYVVQLMYIMLESVVMMWCCVIIHLKSCRCAGKCVDD